MFTGWRGVHRASSAIAGSSAEQGEDGLSVRTYTGNFFSSRCRHVSFTCLHHRYESGRRLLHLLRHHLLRQRQDKERGPLVAALSLSLSAVLSGHLIKIADALDESALCLRMTRARSAERSDCVRLMLQVCDRLVDVCSDVLDAVGDGWALVCLP